MAKLRQRRGENPVGSCSGPAFRVLRSLLFRLPAEGFVLMADRMLQFVRLSQQTPEKRAATARKTDFG
jgi:hypothetical protein